MNVKFKYNLKFKSMVIQNDEIIPNNYNLQLDVSIESPNDLKQNIAIQRIEHLNDVMFNNSLICSEKNILGSKIIKNFKNLVFIPTPDDPYDQLLGILLFHKLNAIVEENLYIEQLLIKSDDYDIEYIIDEYEDVESEIEVPWWSRSDMTVTDLRKYNKLIPAWEEIDLGWEPKSTNNEYVLEMENSKKPEIVVLDSSDTNDNR